MKALPQRWRSNDRYDPGVGARRLKRRFQSVSRRYHLALTRRRFYREAKLLVLAAIVGAGAIVLLDRFTAWPPMTVLKHLASAPNCDAARAVGLAPARQGEPGYWSRHDADRDGIACEVWPRR